MTPSMTCSPAPGRSAGPGPSSPARPTRRVRRRATRHPRPGPTRRLGPSFTRRLSLPAGNCPVTARSMQGMARVRSGQAPAWPLSSDRSVRRGSGVKRDFACTFARHFPPVLVAQRSQSRLMLEGRARTLSGSSPALRPARTHAPSAWRIRQAEPLACRLQDCGRALGAEPMRCYTCPRLFPAIRSCRRSALCISTSMA